MFGANSASTAMWRISVTRGLPSWNTVPPAWRGMSSASTMMRMKLS
jgi:hypothetical protein